MVKVEAGSKTQLANVFAGLLMASIIVFIGQWLRALPMCILSVIIIYALKGVIRNIWLVSFAATVGSDVIQGLVISISFALLTVVFRTQWPLWHFLANLNGTNDFRDTSRYQRVVVYPGVCIFRFDSPLLFTNVDLFKDSINRALDKWIHQQRLNRIRSNPDLSSVVASKEIMAAKSHGDEDMEKYVLGKRRTLIAIGSANSYRHFIIDCSGFTFVDCMGGNALKEVYTEMRAKSVLVYFANAKAPVLDFFYKSGFYSFVPKNNFYPTIRDAVSIAMKRRNATSKNLLEQSAECQYNAIAEAITTQPMH